MGFIHDLNSIISQNRFTLTLPFTIHKNFPSIKEEMELDFKKRMRTKTKI